PVEAGLLEQPLEPHRDVLPVERLTEAVGEHELDFPALVLQDGPRGARSLRSPCWRTRCCRRAAATGAGRGRVRGAFLVRERRTGRSCQAGGDLEEPPQLGAVVLDDLARDAGGE